MPKTPKTDSEIIDFLQELMRRRGRLKAQLAADLGVGHPAVYRWLTGIDVPTPASCRKIAEYSGVPLLQILAKAGHMPKAPVIPADQLPELRDYARGKYPDEIDEDLALALEYLIRLRRERRSKRPASVVFSRNP